MLGPVHLKPSEQGRDTQPPYRQSRGRKGATRGAGTLPYPEPSAAPSWTSGSSPTTARSHTLLAVDGYRNTTKTQVPVDRPTAHRQVRRRASRLRRLYRCKLINISKEEELCRTHADGFIKGSVKAKGGLMVRMFLGS